MNKSSAASAASSACDHMRDWWLGTDEWVSMGVITDGSPYGVDSDLCFSYPVVIKDKEWTIVKDLNLNHFQ